MDTRAIRYISRLMTAVLPLASRSYARLLRPNMRKQLSPDVVALVDELPNVDPQASGAHDTSELL